MSPKAPPAPPRPPALRSAWAAATQRGRRRTSSLRAGSGGWGSVPANRRRISARTRARNVAKISAEHARQEAVPARRADLADIVAAVAHAGLGLDRLDR